MYRSSTCTAAANTGYMFDGFSGDCSGATCELTNITENKFIVANFIKDGIKSLPFTGISSSSQGRLSISGGGAACTLESVEIKQIHNLTSNPTAPTGLVFRQGLVSFKATKCDIGSTLTVTAEFSDSFAQGARYMKWGKTSANPQNHWYELTATLTGNTATYQITDGGYADDDMIANGEFVDPAGPASAYTPPVITAPSQPVPSLSPYMLLLLMIIVLMIMITRKRA